MYEDVRTIEVSIHELIRSSLQRRTGAGETGWWRAIPVGIRTKGQTRHEEDAEPSTEPYFYTDLIDLREILDKQWPVVSESLPKPVASDKRALLTDLLRLNQVRRLVMYPVRGGVPSDDAFEFLRGLKASLGF